MTQILTQTSVAVRTTATAKDDKYEYNVDYQVTEGKNITSLVVTVKSGNDYIGTMILNDENKNINALQTADFEIINTMFDAIIAEVKAGLATV